MKKNVADEAVSTANRNYLDREIQKSNDSVASIAVKYEERFGLRHIYDRQNDFIIQFLRSQSVARLLDLGCGIGNFLVKAQSEFLFTYGIDPSLKRLLIASRFLPKAEFTAGQGERLPFRSEELDAAVLRGVVHHLEVPVKVFREVHRCLRSGGTIVIFEGNRSSIYRRLVLGIADLLRINHESTLFEHRAPSIMKRMLNEAGFEILKCRNISGLFAPIALSGIGGPCIWKAFDSLENLFQTVCPGVFNYYVLLVGRKP